MDPEEIEFLAENILVTIIPTFNSDTITLISGDVGPFRASLPVLVPIWLAVSLKKQQKCKIQPPDWMDVETLEALKNIEKESPVFTKMPSEHYMIEAKILLGYASDDIPNADTIRTIVKDLWDIRMAKVRKSVDLLVKSCRSYAKIDHLTLMEINSMRPILPHAMDHIYRLKSRGARAAQNSTIGSSSLNTTF